ncbi:methyl-accepting chemotaxis protein [Cohnella sp. WQ 127256]|uniref:methyl-accepting chemotaxis protein n=1 Tax=Cohnella sp. WQ 127256 TaxID=2938790 RepID=UPI00211760DF|nr:methyl-accepting chemotaxis protein [Cohnella sp. WQ 127256]
MKWFYDMKTAKKLISAFVMSAVMLGIVGFLGLNNLGKLDQSISSMYDNNLVPINDLAYAQVLHENIKVDLRDMNTMARTEAENKEYKDRILGYKKMIEDRLTKYGQLPVLIQAEKDELEQLTPLWKEYLVYLDKAFEMNSKNLSTAEFTEYLLTSGFEDTSNQIGDILTKLVLINLDLAEQANVDADKLHKTSRNITFAIIMAALLLSIGLGYFISQVIARPLNQIVRLVGQVAGGDLSKTSSIHTKDEIGVLAASVNEMVVQLRSTVGGILVSAESVSAASQQISASTEEIANGSMSQADAAQTMNELFKELSLAINSVAESAEQASELSNRTMNIAKDGGKVVRISIDGMSLVNEQMSRLQEDSNKIGEIIEVIDDIAEQTNLLALNAAIEAARAGDQGRGFAVVADEVRKLAERSSEATKQITKIIKGMQVNTEQGVKAVEEGVASSHRSGEAFENIIAMVSETAHKVTEIAAASEEQAAQSSEVMGAIESISAATEEAAASSEQTASTAQSLAELAMDLNSSVTMFKIQ